MANNPETPTAVGRASQLVINREATNGPNDHRPGDVPLNTEKFAAMQKVDEIAGGIVSRIAMAEGDNGEVKKGENLFAPQDGKFGKNPDDEVGKKDEKIKRLVKEVFDALGERMGAIEKVIGSRNNLGSPQIEEFAKLLSDARLDRGMRTLNGCVGTISPDACSKLRLSYNCLDPENKEDSRWIFLEQLVMKLDRRLRFALYQAGRNKYPNIECHDDSRERNKSSILHPSFRFVFDEKGLSIMFNAKCRDRKDFENGSEMYFKGGGGCSEEIPVSVNGKFATVQVRRFLEQQLLQRNYETA